MSPPRTFSSRTVACAMAPRSTSGQETNVTFVLWNRAHICVTCKRTLSVDHYASFAKRSFLPSRLLASLASWRRSAKTFKHRCSERVAASTLPVNRCYLGLTTFCGWSRGLMYMFAGYCNVRLLSLRRGSRRRPDAWSNCIA